MNQFSTNPVKEKKRKLSFVHAILNPMSRRPRPYVKIEFRKGNFLVKTADTKDELSQVYQLRHEIFYREFAGKSHVLGVDHDRYDKHADMLIIVDLSTGKVVGSYRIICSEFSKRFYSASEFHIDSFLSQEGVKVELSRACIHKDYRNGSAIRLLWRGVYEYLNRVKGVFLFGCSSVSGLSSSSILSLIGYLQKQGRVLADFSIYPHDAYDKSSTLLKDLRDLDFGNMLEHIPALFRAYLNAGAKFEVVPAYDESFLCYDFFTVLNLKDLRQSHSKALGT